MLELKNRKQTDVLERQQVVFPRLITLNRN